MPEILEVERYRRLATRALDRPIAAVDAPDPWYLKRGLDAATLSGALVGRAFERDRRVGKLLLLDVHDGPTLGLRFGMTGALFLDGDPAIARLEYSAPLVSREWNRVVITFVDGGDLRMRDPRRLGGVELDPDESRLGPDSMGLSVAQLRVALDDSRAPLKARLMDQERIAGLGNLLTDEILWRAGLDPARPARSLDPAEQRRLAHHIRATLTELDERGGSHLGELQVARVPGAVCPRDGAPLLRRTIGGRTTYSCSLHQANEG